MTRGRKRAAIVILVTLACAFMAAAFAVIDVWYVKAVGGRYNINFFNGEGGDDMVEFVRSLRGEAV